MKNKKTLWLKLASLALCLCLVIAGCNPVKGVTIPPSELSLSAPAMAMVETVGYFTYEGRYYIQYDQLYDTEHMGEYLGTVMGLLQEWTPEDGLVDFAGRPYGDVYTVEGYDPSFILCKQEVPGAPVITYINNNGITLTYGSELFEDRLHLSDDLLSVQYRSAEKGELYEINRNNEALCDFLSELNSAPFLLSDSVPLPEGVTYLRASQSYYLCFQTKTGMPIHLRLSENGYISFDGTEMVCQKLSEKTCRALLELMDNHTDSTAISKKSF